MRKWRAWSKSAASTLPLMAALGELEEPHHARLQALSQVEGILGSRFGVKGFRSLGFRGGMYVAVYVQTQNAAAWRLFCCSCRLSCQLAAKIGDKGCPLSITVLLGACLNGRLRTINERPTGEP